MRVLADGKTKFVALTEKPVDPENPTATELAGGIDLSFKVLQENFLFGPTDSDKVGEKALGDEGNANVSAASNYQAGFSIWRQFADEVTGGFDPVEDAGFDAVKAKGTSLWLYARKTEKRASEAFEAGDELYFGAEVATDTPQPIDGGWIKYRIPCDVQDGYPFITVAAGV